MRPVLIEVSQEAWANAHQANHPNDFPAKQNWDDVKKNVPPKSKTSSPPRVFYSNKPAELLLFKGKPQAALPKSRSEPIFYNGRTYQLDFSLVSGGVYDMSVSGMSAKQQKDAVAVATSSLGYYACPDGQKGRLQNEPVYEGSQWRMQAKCG